MWAGERSAGSLTLSWFALGDRLFFEREMCLVWAWERNEGEGDGVGLALRDRTVRWRLSDSTRRWLRTEAAGVRVPECCRWCLESLEAFRVWDGESEGEGDGVGLVLRGRTVRRRLSDSTRRWLRTEAAGVVRVPECCRRWLESPETFREWDGEPLRQQNRCTASRW
jgi:hypothetical protein